MELPTVIQEKYHNVSKKMPHKKEIRNSKAATHKTRYEYIYGHWYGNGVEPDLSRKMNFFEGPSSTLRRSPTPKPRTPRETTPFKVPLDKFSAPET